MPFMRTAADLASNAENLGHIRRAHQGVCWTLRIPVLPRNDDPLDVQMARRAALRAAATCPLTTSTILPFRMLCALSFIGSPAAIWRLGRLRPLSASVKTPNSAPSTKTVL